MLGGMPGNEAYARRKADMLPQRRTRHRRTDTSAIWPGTKRRICRPTADAPKPACSGCTWAARVTMPRPPLASGIPPGTI